MRASRAAVVAASLLVLLMSGPFAAQAPARKLQLTFDNQGNVTLIAEGVTVNEILREWTRVGGSQFPGAEKLAGQPLPPVQFENRPEDEVLKSLLRSAAGHIIAPRRAGSAGPSRFDVKVIATSTATASSAYSSPMSPAVPVVTPGVMDEEPPPSLGQVQGVVQGKAAEPPGGRPATPAYGSAPAPITVPVIQPIGTVPQSGTQKSDQPQPPMGGTTGRGGGGGN
jgi:hypothetical protein